MGQYFQKNGAILLKGESEFYWNKLLSSEEDFLTNLNHKRIIEIPGKWNNQFIDGKYLPTYGYATYRIFLKLPSAEKKRYSLKIRDQAHAYKLFIDGKFIKEWGKVGTDFQTTKPEMQPDIISFENKSETLEIVFQVANFHHRVSGLRYRIWFGEEDQISKLHQKYLIIDSFLFGGIFLISVYYFVIYNFRSKSLSSLYFAFFCLSVLAYVMGTEERTIFYFLGDFINWDWKYKFEFIWLSLIPCFLVLFFYYLFPFYKESFLKFVIPIHLVVSFLFILLILFTPPKVFSELLYILEIDRVLLSLVIVYFMIKAIKDKKEGSILFLTGFLVIFLFSMLDVLTARSVINAPRITKFGLSLMVLLQAIILAKAFTRDFKTTEKLTKSLSGINQSLSKFVPTEFFKLLGKESFADIKLGDHVQKEMTILFSDIRAFTTLSEQMTPEENFKFINSYLNEITPIIKKNNGFIDKFIGDAIMGLFPGTADDAVRASIEIQKTITEFNNSRKSSGLPELKVGIGLHTGDLILGTIGHDERMESTVISDSVNLASRIEGLTKFYGSEILISEDTFNELEDPYVYKVRLLDNVIVKGKKDSIFVVEVLDGFSEDLLEKFSKTRELFETGSLMYKQAAFEAAIDYFKKVLDINPQDTASAFYLKRAEYYNVHGAPPEWEGIEEFLDK